MTNGTTSTGFVFQFDETALDDMRLIDALGESVDTSKGEIGQVMAISKLLTLLIGAEQKDRLYAHIGARHENGRVPAMELRAELDDMVRQAGQDNAVKN